MTIAPLALTLLLPLGVFGIFESVWTAAGAAGVAVSIPIVIHLLNRRRFKVVTWAAMRFLLAAQKKNSRRLRLEQMLLLATRCLMVLLLVLAMASISGWAETLWHKVYATQTRSHGPRTYKLIVLDGSFSMGVRDGDRTLFDKARAEAAKVVRNSSPGDAFSVVLMTWPGRGMIVSQPSEDAARVAAEIEKLRMPHGNADLPATLETVAGLLQATPGKFPHREIYFFSDLQQSTWPRTGPSGIQGALDKLKTQRARTIVVDVGRKEPTDNLAVTSLRLDGEQVRVGSRTNFVTTLHNFGSTEIKQVVVRWLVGKAPAADTPGFEPKEVFRDVRDLGPSKEVPCNFQNVFDEAGEYVVQVRLGEVGQPIDLLPIDDVRSIVVRAGPKVPVLVVEGRTTGPEELRPAYTLRPVLNKMAKVKVIGIDDFADEGRGDLTPYDCVFLCDVPQLTKDMVKRLTTHVRRGGGLIICLGDNINAEAYNEELFANGTGLMPVPLTHQQTKTTHYNYQFNQEQTTRGEPPLHNLAGNPEQEALVEPRFRRFWEVGPGPSGGLKPREVLSFRPEQIQRGQGSVGARPPSGPAVLEWQPPLKTERGLSNPEALDVARRMPGRVLLFTAKVGLDPENDPDADGNWPSSEVYAILMNDLMFYAASARLQEQSSDAGRPLELLLPGPGGDRQATMFLPDVADARQGRQQKVRCLDQGDVGVYMFFDTNDSGIYRLQIPGEPRQRLFAVNAPTMNAAQASESDLARVEDLTGSYPNWDLQVVRDPAEADHTPRDPPPTREGVVETPTTLEALGPGIARWLLLGVLILGFVEVALAWGLGRHTTIAQPEQGPPRVVHPWKDWAFYQRWALRLLPPVLWLGLAGIAAILIHEAFTGDFLGFLSDNTRQWLEQSLGIPEPPPGEGRRWRLEYHEYLVRPQMDIWLAPLLFVGGAVFVAIAYFNEGVRNTLGSRIRLIGLRVAFLALLFGMLLPRLDWLVERQGYPDVVLLIDDSESMAAQDEFADPRVRAMAERLAAVLPPEENDPKAHVDPYDLNSAELPHKYALPRGARLRLAAALLTRPDPDWLADLLINHKVRLHIYTCSALAARLRPAVAEPRDLESARADIRKLLKSPTHGNSSQLGKAVRQVLNEFRGTSLAAIIMFTDGVTTEDEDLAHVAGYAREVNVPLYFIGIGDAHDVPDVYLHDLQCEDSVFVHDNLIFDARITAQGFKKGLHTFVHLREKGSDKDIEQAVQVSTDGTGKPVKFTLQHKPRTPGPKTYVLYTDVQSGQNDGVKEIDTDNNTIEKAVFVREARTIKVLYVDGYGRYEYQKLKTLLERESDRLKNNKSIDLRVLLLDADESYQVQDRSAVGRKVDESGKPLPKNLWDPYAFPTRAQLAEYDVVILGDIDPVIFEPNNPSRRLTKENLKDLADFVVTGGGGLLVISGERGTPAILKTVPQLAEVLPIELTTDRMPPDRDRPAGYRLDLTPLGRAHPIFRFSPDERDNEELFRKLRDMYWYAEGYRAKRTAGVLANHASSGGDGAERQPLVLQQFSGAGRCLFFGFNETWRWASREEQGLYNQFWIKTIRYLSRNRLGRIDLRLEPQVVDRLTADRQTAYQANGYRRGDPIKVTVHFPDDVPPPDANARVEVRLKRRGPDGESPERLLTLTPQANSPATFEAILNQTPEGLYRFQLVTPSLNPPPRAECKVVVPPGETFCLRLDQAALETAAEVSHGAFYNLADADKLLKEIRVDTRVDLNAACPPWPLWNHMVIFLIALGLLATEWLLRKDMNLL